MPRSLSGLVMLVTRESIELIPPSPDGSLEHLQIHPLAAIDWAHAQRTDDAISTLCERVKKRVLDDPQSIYAGQAVKRFASYRLADVPQAPLGLDSDQEDTRNEARRTFADMLSNCLRSILQAVRQDAKLLYRAIFFSELQSMGIGGLSEDNSLTKGGSADEYRLALLTQFRCYLLQDESLLMARHAVIFARLNKYGMIARTGNHSGRWSLRSDISDVLGLDLLTEAAAKADKAVGDLDQRLTRLFDCATHIAAAVGSSPSNGERVGPTVIKLRVDTTYAGLAGTPTYVTSSTGGFWHWGINSIHEPSEAGFTIYIDNYTGGDPSGYGGIHWLAVDSDVVFHAGTQRLPATYTHVLPNIEGCQHGIGDHVLLASLGSGSGHRFYDLEGANLFHKQSQNGFYTYLLYGKKDAGAPVDSVVAARDLRLNWLSLHPQPYFGGKDDLRNLSAPNCCQPGCGGADEAIHREPNRELCRLVFHVRHRKDVFSTGPYYFTALGTNDIQLRGYDVIYPNGKSTNGFMLFIEHFDRAGDYEVYEDGGQTLHWLGIEPMNYSNPDAEFPVLLV